MDKEIVSMKLENPDKALKAYALRNSYPTKECGRDVSCFISNTLIKTVYEIGLGERTVPYIGIIAYGYDAAEIPGILDEIADTPDTFTEYPAFVAWDITQKEYEIFIKNLGESLERDVEQFKLLEQEAYAQ